MTFGIFLAKKSNSMIIFRQQISPQDILYA